MPLPRGRYIAHPVQTSSIGVCAGVVSQTSRGRPAGVRQGIFVRRSKREPAAMLTP